ncbi:MAG: iron-containing alcohol dehydrogenase, partial [Umezawaea sp.]
MNDVMTGTLRLPTRVHFGYGTREQLGEVLRMSGRRVLAVVDPFLIGTAIFDEVVERLRQDGFEVAVHSDVLPELPTSSLDAAAEFAREFRPDVVLAVGGGSALDAAKLVGLLAVHGGPLSRYYGENLVPGPSLPLVAVPTTAGTGSEATRNAVISERGPAGWKRSFRDERLVAADAIVDP